MVSFPDGLGMRLARPCTLIMRIKILNDTLLCNLALFAKRRPAMALLGIVSWSLVVDTLRLISICSFLVCSLQFTWFSFVSLIAVLGKAGHQKTV